MEKELTDEEIVKALENGNSGYGCGVVGNLYQMTIDLIHRQKAEIERLTELQSRGGYRVAELSIENAELQKQVNECEERVRAAYVLGYKESKIRVVKDVTKELFKEIFESCVFSFKGNEDYKKGFCDALEQYDKQLRDLAKQNGVEVE
jgi:hypothetical protein